MGGTDIAPLNSTMLMKNFSIVFQDVVLFNNTIMENIRVGKKDATDEEVIAAAKAAQCDEFISKLPDGYQTVIGENGSTLRMPASFYCPRSFERRPCDSLG